MNSLGRYGLESGCSWCLGLGVCPTDVLGIAPRLALPRFTRCNAFLSRLSGSNQVKVAVNGGDSFPKSAYKQRFPSFAHLQPGKNHSQM